MHGSVNINFTHLFRLLNFVNFLLFVEAVPLHFTLNLTQVPTEVQGTHRTLGFI